MLARIVTRSPSAARRAFSSAAQALAVTPAAKFTPASSSPAAAPPASTTASRPAPAQDYPAASTASSSSSSADAHFWATSFQGMSTEPFSSEIAKILSAPLTPEDIEIKPDGLLYLPEIKYRRILNKAFGPGGWGLAPRGETNVGPKIVSREWVLVCLGRFVSTARGEQEYFDPSGVATASEGAKSNALMRCCKDLGIASELWDPRFIREFKKKHCIDVFTENASTGRKRKLWRRRDAPPFEFPNKESK
ncbi:unnamed protein product [Tilletia controversa]|uniref:Mitochondrial genome maintenance protein MGM101 n=3 Tax=Tilletia TaxID=13289 RepID=A0A8X7MWW6_9BASI|nr:hypothetical protein CF336_g1846 [Tilletia laevis]KAE8198681.1 hypothetical protein CF328_g3478 [Tilletia controversa]KAE8261572.1 hypothetical protein A4X03_0g3137 [Tilletia caries]KAE8207350.1 hypothetical protein CF335_g1204 [Tilletia laevis]KAE8252341.1 hypothetical protein A4X06_0g2262 [Tilletia controversa]